MQQALEFLRDHKEIALATCEGNLPKLRLFQIMKQDGTHLYFATSPEKAVYRQLLVNPNVEDFGNRRAGVCALRRDDPF